MLRTVIERNPVKKREKSQKEDNILRENIMNSSASVWYRDAAVGPLPSFATPAAFVYRTF